MNNKKELLDILRDLNSHLIYQKNMGLERLLTDPEHEGKEENKSKSTSEYNMVKDDKKIIKITDQAENFDPGEKLTIEEIREDLGECTRCKLHKTRNKIVFGDGNPNARLVFVGEGPGRDEDEQGLPFVGRAGKLLTKIIEAMGLTRQDVYICNVVKCRPPGNRNPEADEVAACEPFLFKQIRSISPEVIVCLGSVATSLLLKMKQPRMGDLRGKFHEYLNSKLMITYHPAALLRNPNFKKPVWEDMKLVLKELNLPIPGD